MSRMHEDTDGPSKRHYVMSLLTLMAGGFAVYCFVLLVVNTISAFEGDYSAAWMVSGFLLAAVALSAVIARVSWRFSIWGSQLRRDGQSG